MNIEKAKEYLKKESHMQISKVINDYEFQLYSEYVAMTTPISLDWARKIAKVCPGVTFGIEKEKNPDEVATSKEFEECVIAIRNMKVSEKFVENEKRGLRIRLIEYYDENKDAYCLYVRSINIYSNEELKKIVEMIKEY